LFSYEKNIPLNKRIKIAAFLWIIYLFWSRSKARFMTGNDFNRNITENTSELRRPFKILFDGESHKMHKER